jgi:hypothetical protein
LSHFASPFVWSFFEDRVWGTICIGWLRISILLIFASWIATITGVSHRLPAKNLFYYLIRGSLLSTLRPDMDYNH